jgi:hypothetical protein
MRPVELTVLPIYLAKRMVENRGGEATEEQGRLFIRRNGQFLGSAQIEDGCVNFRTVCIVFSGRWP